MIAMAPLKSEVRFHRGAHSDTVRVLDHARITASSETFGWKGVLLEVGENNGCEVDELMVDGHYVGIQLNDAPISVSIRPQSSQHWTDTQMPSHTLWIHPEGTPFSIRHTIYSYWAGAVINGDFLDSVLGAHHELRGGWGVDDPLLAHQLLSLIELLRDQRPGGAAHDGRLSASLLSSFALALGRRHGVQASALPQNGGIAPRQLKTLLAWVQEHLETPLTVEAMAARTGLSTAHFSREFKRSMGVTPWAYVIELRLQAAHDLLKQGQAVGDVAHRCGFADQSHLSRAMRARYGQSPGEIMGARRPLIAVTPKLA